MRTGIMFTLSASDRKRLKAIIADPKSPQKHVWRARIVLLSGDGAGTNAIMAKTGKSKTCVWRWQERFMTEGIAGLLTDKSRPPGIAPTAPDKVAEIVRLTHEPPPNEATHWTLRAMAKIAGVAPSTVQAIWKAHGLAPHRWRTFKLNRAGFPGGPNFWKDGVHGDEETDEAVPGGAARSRRPAGARARSRARLAVGGDQIDRREGWLQRRDAAALG
jgi:transposase